MKHQLTLRCEPWHLTLEVMHLSGPRLAVVDSQQAPPPLRSCEVRTLWAPFLFLSGSLH